MAKSSQVVTESMDDFSDADQLDRSHSELASAISALLFSSPRPLSSRRLSELTDTSIETVEAALKQVAGLFRDELHGLSLRSVAGAWQLRTSPAHSELLQQLIPPRARRLSRAAAETLAVVAYKQPVSRADIEAIRGVDAIPTLKTLLDARLIRAIGREDSAGHPALYGTTDLFLEKYGLRDLSELPTVREIAELASDPGETAVEEDTEESEEFEAYAEETSPE